MTEEQTTLFLIKGAISEMEPAEQEKLKACADKLRTLVGEQGDLGVVALGLVGAELAAKA